MKWSFLTQMDESLSQQDVYSYTLLNPWAYIIIRMGEIYQLDIYLYC
jgi:hypothetical protein